MSKPLTDEELLRELLSRRGFTGDWKRTLVFDGHIVTLSATVRQQVNYQDAGQHMERALQVLREGYGELPNCGESTTKKSFYGSSRCRNSISAAIVYSGVFRPQFPWLTYNFVCTTHARLHRGTVVRLPPYRLRPIIIERRRREATKQLIERWRRRVLYVAAFRHALDNYDELAARRREQKGRGSW